ncbi:hypothetical protein V493_02161 [Pseudogymnoascus sp. VKM F-4281 (FW-2241)]|nr:hypothetical protein V493_02161 [Pseudogymnoascus sp. VKM F-4281 (FW-2241)]
MAGPHASIDPAYIKYNNMIVNRHKYFRWTKRTAFLSFAYVIAVPAFVGYWAFVTDDFQISSKTLGPAQSRRPPVFTPLCHITNRVRNRFNTDLFVLSNHYSIIVMEGEVPGPRACHSCHSHLENPNTSQGNPATDIETNIAGSGPPMTTGEGTGDALESAPPESPITMSDFAVISYKNGILPPAYSRPPTNLCELIDRVERIRVSNGPTAPDPNKPQKDIDDENNYQQVYNQPLTGFPKDVVFNNGLPPPQPEFIAGLRKEAFEPFPLERVIGAVLYEDDMEEDEDDPNDFHSIVLPHIAGEVGNPEGSMERATLQCAYDGATLVYARNKALEFIGKPDPLGLAVIVTYTFVSDIMEFFAHYAAPGDDGKLEYHQYPIGSCDMSGTCPKGGRGIQNSEDYTWEQSRFLRDQLVDYWEAKKGIALSTPGSCRRGVLFSFGVSLRNFVWFGVGASVAFVGAHWRRLR